MLVIGAFIGVLVLAYAGYATFSLLWLRGQTIDDRYFARPLAERRALKAEIRRRGRTFVALMNPLGRVLSMPVPDIVYRGVRLSPAKCPSAMVKKATNYEPQAGDIFVATQMKCGTTWMQQVVYEVLCHGRGNLGDDGHRHLYALSPWIESRQSVPLKRAPRVGEREERIIKTHLPTRLCPYSAQARYIYVTRHPVACFASCVDFVRMMAGPFAPSLSWFLDWYCSDKMWWLSWPENVEGWWQWAQTRPNVIFIHFEEMLENLPATVDRVADFLEVELTPEERDAVVYKSSYDYMKTHEEVFEMASPNYFSMMRGSFFQSGSKGRARDVEPEQRNHILAFCRKRLANSDYPLARFYPDTANTESLTRDP